MTASTEIPSLWGTPETIAKPKPKPSKKRKKKQKGGSTLNSISFVTGPLGCGKSYFAMEEVIVFGAAGKVIATNFDLQGAWWATMRSRSSEGKRLKGDEARAWEAECRSRVHRYDVMDDLYDFRLPGKGENRGLLVLDEGGLNMNSRLYQMRQKADMEKHKNPIKALQFYINMRKRGWTCLILAHSAEHLDNQVRDMGGGIIKLRNFARIKMPLVGISFSKNPRFQARYFTPDVSMTKAESWRFYGLDTKVAQHYRSMDEFEFMPESTGIRLQRPPGPLAIPADGLPELPAISGGGGRRPEGAPTPAAKRRPAKEALRRVVRSVLVRD